MGRVSREKWERKLQAAMQFTDQVKSASPWYESNLFLAAVSTSIAIILSVVAAMKGDRTDNGRIRNPLFYPIGLPRHSSSSFQQSFQ
ncbi:MAG: hypothetical protein ACREJN_15010 [Nitrospiraceae bacterium]